MRRQTTGSVTLGKYQKLLVEQKQAFDLMDAVVARNDTSQKCVDALLAVCRNLVAINASLNDTAAH